MWKRWILAGFVIVIIGIVYLFRGYLFGPSATVIHDHTNEDFGISSQISTVDQDKDGIDDQTDILQGARNYIATKPIYESRYYAGGYPDDGYGVCTDVVAFALRDAGYDLRDLVLEDVKNHSEGYSIDVPDANIDYRRVRNLKVYFDRHALSLTTDLSQIDQWQGGDIVVFSNHIGIVSDVRNRHGIPYVIHHSSRFQTAYEQDILEKRDDIIGHYRISE